MILLSLPTTGSGQSGSLAACTDFIISTRHARSPPLTCRYPLAGSLRAPGAAKGLGGSRGAERRQAVRRRHCWRSQRACASMCAGRGRGFIGLAGGLGRPLASQRLASQRQKAAGHSARNESQTAEGRRWIGPRTVCIRRYSGSVQREAADADGRIGVTRVFSTPPPSTEPVTVPAPRALRKQWS